MNNTTTFEKASFPSVVNPVPASCPKSMPIHYLASKRLVDLTVLLMLAPFYLPLMLVLAMIVRLSSPGPIFYSQRRIGLGLRYFYVWKFRTMVANADEVLESHLAANPELRDEWERDHKLRKDPRVTAIGRFLRKCSLDELPQLWNVGVGDMSLVGPRPIVDAEVKKYSTVIHHYEKVLPGITGMWQINGRNNTTYSERLEYDADYVTNWSLRRDLWILFRTIKTVVLCEGAF